MIAPIPIMKYVYTITKYPQILAMVSFLEVTRTLLPVLADSNVMIPSSPALLYAHSKCESINPDSAIYCAIDFVIVLFSCMVLKTNKSTFV